MILRDIYRHEAQSTQDAAVALSSSAEIERLVVENFHQTTADGMTAPVWDIKGTIRQLLEHKLLSYAFFDLSAEIILNICSESDIIKLTKEAREW